MSHGLNYKGKKKEKMVRAKMGWQNPSTWLKI